VIKQLMIHLESCKNADGSNLERQDFRICGKRKAIIILEGKGVVQRYENKDNQGTASLKVLEERIFPDFFDLFFWKPALSDELCQFRIDFSQSLRHRF